MGIDSAPVETVEPSPLYRNRDFNLLWTGAAISQFGTILSITAFPLLVLAVTRSAALAGVVAAAAQAPNLLVQLPAGVLVDRWNRKTVMIVCDVARVLTVGSVPVAMWLGVLAMPQLVAAAFLEGSFAVFHRLAEFGAVRNVVPKQQYRAAVAATQARTFGAALLGRPAAGFLYDISRGIPFVADSMTYLVSALATAFTRGAFQEERVRRPATNPYRDAVEGFRWLWQRPFLRSVNLMLPYATLILQALPLAVIVIAREKGFSATMIGVLLLGFSIGGLTGSLLGGWLHRRLSLRVVVIGSPWLWATCMAAMATTPAPLVLIGATAGVGLGNATWNVVVTAYQLTLIPDTLIARVNAASRLLSYSGAALGGLVVGVLLEAYGGRRGVLILAVSTAILAVAATLSRTLRNPR